MATLAYGATTIALSDDLLWTDEFGWSAVEQQRTYTLTGALIVETAVKGAGRPFTLSGGEDAGWVTRSVLDALYTAAAIPGQQFTLTLRGVAHTVMFDTDPIEAEPVIDFNDPAADDSYVVTLKFFKV